MVFHVTESLLFHTDESIPTVSLGVANTETGHCAKTLALMGDMARRMGLLRSDADADADADAGNRRVFST